MGGSILKFVYYKRINCYDGRRLVDVCTAALGIQPDYNTSGRYSTLSAGLGDILCGLNRWMDGPELAPQDEEESSPQVSGRGDGHDDFESVTEQFQKQQFF